MKQHLFSSLVLLIAFSQGCVFGERVGFFYALSEDFAVFEKLAGPPITTQMVGKTAIHSFIVGKHRVYTAKMGSGCVQTAVSAQALLTLNRCDLVISCGPAGALDDQVKIGDWFVASKATAYQRGNFDFTGFSIAPTAEIDVADTDLINLLPHPIQTANVASGEIFVAAEQFRAELNSRFGCSLVEMNLFGLVTTMQSHDLAGIHLRIVSDLANAEASQDFRSFTETYDGAGGALVHQWISNLPSSGESPIEYQNLRRLLE